MSDPRAAAIDRLQHMVEAARAIQSYVARGRAVFDRDSAVQDAILYQIIVLGEAAKAVVKTNAALAGDLSDVEWSLMAKMRDRVAHRYWETDHDLVWATATKDIPALNAALVSALDRVVRQ